jgi:hypothetical protein
MGIERRIESWGGKLGYKNTVLYEYHPPGD